LIFSVEFLKVFPSFTYLHPVSSDKSLFVSKDNLSDKHLTPKNWTTCKVC